MTATLLIISFSNISQDARVLKQVRLFSKKFKVVTCGEGPAPAESAEHLELPHSGEGLPSGKIGRLAFALVFSGLQMLRLHSLCYRMAPQIRAARRALSGRSFDAVLCDDIQPLPLLADLFPLKRIHADVHEYFPGMHDQDPKWRLLWLPYYRWMIRRFLTRVASVTTVTDAIAVKYQKEFGINACGVVMNAAPYQELPASLVSSRIRVVHSGAAVANRRIEHMMQAVAESQNDLTLDLFLLPSEASYFSELQELAEHLGENITVHSAVPQHDLVRTLNAFDIGISVLAATNTNNVLALPNKFFDYIQARLGIITSPSVDMEHILAAEGLGVTTESADPEAIVAALDALDPEKVREWKRNASSCARKYSAEEVSGDWERAINALVA